MTSTWKAPSPGLETGHVFADSVTFKQLIYCSSFSFFCGHHQLMSSKFDPCSSPNQGK